MERKDFIRMVSAAALGGVAGTGLHGCAPYRYVDGRLTGDRLEVPKESFEESDYLLVRNPRSSAPIYLRRHKDDTYTALLMECTHRQCTVNPAGSVLACPCHGSRYNLEGKVLEGPARRDLGAFRVHEEGASVYIELQT